MKIKIEREEIESIVARHLNINVEKVRIHQKINAFTSDEIYIEAEVDSVSTSNE